MYVGCEGFVLYPGTQRETPSSSFVSEPDELGAFVVWVEACLPVVYVMHVLHRLHKQTSSESYA